MGSVNTKRSIAAVTLGCKVNSYDTDAILGLFVSHGYEIVDFSEKADVYLVNTCTVTGLGNKKSRQMIRRAKKQNPDAVVVAAGCYSQVSPEEVSKIQGINLVLGTKDRTGIVALVQNYHPEQGVVSVVTDVMKEKEFEKLQITKQRKHTRAYVKIQDGCNRFCSYCIIPYARGAVRSRDIDDIMDEVEQLSSAGFREIILAGIHVASYGNDMKNIGLLDVVKQVGHVSGIDRIRFSSIEPTIVTDEFIDVLTGIPQICDHFHLSLQSGSDSVLSRMNRRYTTNQYTRAVELIRLAYPNAGLTTDVIVGFPGETDYEFSESCQFIKQMGFAKIHVFPFSPKKGTKADEMDGQIPSCIKEHRCKSVIELQDTLSRRFLKGFIDKELPVLFESQASKDVYEGHTSNYIKVRVESQENLMNKILPVTFREIQGLIAIGEVC